jgi:predicted enzyme related to lactoylglutathione lyase
MPNPVVHFEIIGKDQKLLENFYKSVFDWQITPLMEGYSLVTAGSKIIAMPCFMLRLRT